AVAPPARPRHPRGSGRRSGQRTAPAGDHGAAPCARRPAEPADRRRPRTLGEYLLPLAVRARHRRFRDPFLRTVRRRSAVAAATRPGRRPCRTRPAERRTIGARRSHRDREPAIVNEPTVEVHLTDADLTAALHADARRGLTDSPKWLPPKWFYDARGSELFEQITALPEYYPTRTERALLENVAGAIARTAQAEVLVELGSGSASKTRLLLTALTAEGPLKTYVPQDVSESALRASAAEVALEFPGLAVHGVVSDFTDTLATLPRG